MELWILWQIFLCKNYFRKKKWMYMSLCSSPLIFEFQMCFGSCLSWEKWARTNPMRTHSGTHQTKPGGNWKHVQTYGSEEKWHVLGDDGILSTPVSADTAQLLTKMFNQYIACPLVIRCIILGWNKLLDGVCKNAFILELDVDPNILMKKEH